MLEIISIHIAKTGGRSFFEVLKDQYGNQLDPRYKRIHYFPRKNYHNKLINRIPEEIKVIHGHLYYEHVKELHQKYNSRIITWFREPAERVISNYYYLMNRVREDNSHPLFHKKDYTLLEYANDSITNKMSRYLEGIELDGLFFFGFQEKFDEGLQKLSGMLEWKNPIKNHRENKGKDSSEFPDIATPKESITPGMKDEIRKLNSRDVDLYNKALELYRKKFID